MSSDKSLTQESNFSTLGNDLSMYDTCIILNPRANDSSDGSYFGHIPFSDGTISVYAGMNGENPQGRIITFESNQDLTDHSPGFDEEGTRQFLYLDEAGDFSVANFKSTHARNAARTYANVSEQFSSTEAGQDYLESPLHGRILSAIIPEGDSKVSYNGVEKMVDASDLALMKEGLESMRTIIQENDDLSAAVGPVSAGYIDREINEIETAGSVGSHLVNLNAQLDDLTNVTMTEKKALQETIGQSMPAVAGDIEVLPPPK